MSISAASNTVGGPYPEDGNIIAFNANVGVQVWTYPGNTIRRNSINSNAYAGIFLADGGNNSSSAPVVTDVLPTSVSGTACPGCIVEVFSDE
jgi:parallel beta-helix repeat protein